MSKSGRPRQHDRERIFEAVCAAMATGKTTAEAAREQGVSAGQIRHWVKNVPDFRALYARAREDMVHCLAEEVLALADASTAEDVQRVKLQVDSRKWFVSKLAPHLYGERTTLEHTGAIATADVSADMTPDQRKQAALAILHAVAARITSPPAESE